MYNVHVHNAVRASNHKLLLLEVISQISVQCSAFDLFKNIEKLAVGIELQAGYFSLDNWTRNSNKDNSVEIHQMSDSTYIIIAPEQPPLC